MAFVANKSKAKQGAPKFTSESRSFTPAVASSNLVSDIGSKLVLESSSMKPTNKFVKIEEELKVL